jgi:hypothetical protein
MTADQTTAAEQEGRLLSHLRVAREERDENRRRYEFWRDKCAEADGKLVGEHAAYLRGLRRAAEIARRVHIPGECSAAEAHGRMVGALAAAEAILAEAEGGA